MKAIDIIWDTEGDIELLNELPTEMMIPEEMTDEEEISDYLTKETGFCHKGFVIETNKNQEDIIMNVVRKITVETKSFKLGDIISFELTTGEPVEAMAVRKTSNGMLFIFVDCLSAEQPMFENISNVEYVDYEHSDLRRKLNREIFESFPEEIREHMIGMRVGNCLDMVRIPTEKEIFGKNDYGEDEPETVRHFYGMEEHRNRIAWLGSNTNEFEWYWLQNTKKTTEDCDDRFVHEYNDDRFVLSLGCGYEDYNPPTTLNGVRPVFLLSC